MLKSTGTTQLTLLPQLDTRKAALRPRLSARLPSGSRKTRYLLNKDSSNTNMMSSHSSIRESNKQSRPKIVFRV